VRKLETTSKNSNKVIVYTILKDMKISIDELLKYAKQINMKIESPQHILELEDAIKLKEYIEIQKQKLYFNPKEWNSYSFIDKLENLNKFIDKTLKSIDMQIEQNKTILKNANKSYKELQLLKMDNKELIKIKKYLLSKFDFSLENLKDKLIFMKSEILKELDNIDDSYSIWNDYKLSQKDIDFNFSTKKIVRWYEEQMRKLSNFSNIDKFFINLLKEIKNLQKLDEKFKTTGKQKLETILKEKYLEEYNEKIYNEWKDENDKIDSFYIRFIKAYFIGQIPEKILLNIFTILNSIKNDLEEFYIDVRAGLIIKYKDNPKSNFIQEVATKDKIFKIYQKAQTKTIELLREEKSQVTYRFLNELLKELLNFKIENQIKDYNELYEKMAQLHSKNLEIYLDDVVMYGKELEKRDIEISTLMFKMMKDLEKGE